MGPLAALSLATGALAALLPLATVETSGSLGERLQLSAPSSYGPASTRDLPVISSLLEGNAQLRLRAWDERIFVLSDASVLLPGSWLFFDRPADGDSLERVDDHDLGERARLHVSELYVRARLADHLELTLGKRRVTWGTGFAFVPTDVLNPLRDPTDPSLQRTGVPLVLLDAAFERFTLSALFAPGVLEESAGLPTRLFAWPDVEPRATELDPAGHPDPRDESLHAAGALRAYALIGDADVNLWGLFVHRWGDDDRTLDPRLAASFSRVFLGIHEVHAELLLQQGSDRLSADPRCVDDDASKAPRALATCVARGIKPIAPRWQSDAELRPRLLVGSRSMFDDESMLAVEWLFETDGLDREELDDLLTIQARLSELQRAGLAPPSASNDDGLPSRLSGRLLRRHHLAVTFQKPHVLDDFTVQAGTIVALEDLSSLTTTSLAWQAEEWLTLSFWLFLPRPSLARLLDRVGVEDGHLALAPAIVDDRPLGAFDATPFAARLLFEARAFF